MSEIINNREYRKQAIKEILMDLHDGKSLEEARAKFSKTFSGVASTEIAAAEAALIAEGVPLEEVQRLCDVHAALFSDSLEAAETALVAEGGADSPGHPVHTLRLENRAIEKVIEMRAKPAMEAWIATGDEKAKKELKDALAALANIKQHYQRKENLIFPFMEQHDITAPPKVMWGVDDEIRAALADAAGMASEENPDRQKVADAVRAATDKINEMIFKEENIMIPMVLEAFSPSEWKHIADDSDEIGYCLIGPPPAFRLANAPSGAADPMGKPDAGSIVLPTGAFQVNELVGMLNTLPFDITFVDKNDTVKYFSQGEERIFPRTKTVIGRQVTNCHPPASVHIVEGIVADFKSGRKTHEDFWISMGGKYVYIRYFAVRDENGEYLGTLEVTQNIAPIQDIAGEKRLVE